MSEQSLKIAMDYDAAFTAARTLAVALETAFPQGIKAIADQALSVAQMYSLETGLLAAGIKTDLHARDWAVGQLFNASIEVPRQMSYGLDVRPAEITPWSGTGRITELEGRVDDLEAEIRMISPLPDAEDLN